MRPAPEPRPDVDRRLMLKRLAAAGAVGWVAPLIDSRPAFANGGTPKCRPVGGPTVSAATITCTGGTGVRIAVGWSATCPCVGATQSCSPRVRFTSLTRAGGLGGVELEQAAGCGGGANVALNQWITIGGGVNVVVISTLTDQPISTGTSVALSMDFYSACLRYGNRRSWVCSTATINIGVSCALLSGCTVTSQSLTAGACPGAIDIDSCPA